MADGIGWDRAEIGGDDVDGNGGDDVDGNGGDSVDGTGM